MRRNKNEILFDQIFRFLVSRELHEVKFSFIFIHCETDGVGREKNEKKTCDNTNVDNFHFLRETMLMRRRQKSLS